MNPTHSLSAWSLILDASPLVKLVLLLLLAASVLCWTIIFNKSNRIKSAKNGNAEFLDLFWSAKNLEDVQIKTAALKHSPVAQVFEAGYRELRKMPEMSNIQRALNRTLSVEVEQLEKHVDFLATTASAAPFVGLFGTVWGIMNSFQNIGAMGSANLAVVAPGISEALIATAMGLAAAIPAAVAYNLLLNRIKKISLDSENFAQDFLNMIQRSLLTKKEGKNAAE